MTNSYIIECLASHIERLERMSQAMAKDKPLAGRLAKANDQLYKAIKLVARRERKLRKGKARK